MSRQQMPWSLRWFPAWVSPVSMREFPFIGESRGRSIGKADIGVTEREWTGLTSLTLSVGMTCVAFYGESLASLKHGFREALEKIGRRDGTKANSVILYNGAHAASGRIGVFSTAHPHNQSYRTCLEAVLHDDGEISASVRIQRPWQSGEIAFPPGIFEAIQIYLSRHGTTRRH